MKHHVYEEWVFGLQDSKADNLIPEQVQEMERHLEECQSCQQLAGAWKEVEARLRRSTLVAPAAGFADRWQMRLAENRRRVQGRQIVLALAFCLAAVVLLTGSLLLIAIPWSRTPELLVWFGISRIFNLLSFAEIIHQSLGIFTSAVTGVIPMGVWIILVGIASELMVLWLVSVRLLTRPRRVLV